MSVWEDDPLEAAEADTELDDDGSDFEVETVFLPGREFTEERVRRLPILLNGTKRRRKTLQSLFLHLADTVYRCQEFPHGVYINRYGEVLPEDKRSGIYQPAPPGSESPGPATDEDTGRQSETEDEFEADPDEQDEDDGYEDEDEDEEEDGYGADEEERRVALPPAKRRKTTHDEEHKIPEQKLLEEEMETIDRAVSVQKKFRDNRLRVRKWINEVEKAELVWRRQMKPLCSNVFLTYDSYLFTSDPGCTFVFRRDRSTGPIVPAATVRFQAPIHRFITSDGIQHASFLLALQHIKPHLTCSWG